MPLLVGLLAVSMTALLVWKPWDRPGPQATAAAIQPTPAASPSSTAPPMSGAPPSRSPVDPPRPTTAPAVRPAPLPSPDLAPLGPAGEFTLAGAEANARCEYDRAVGGERRLRSIEVAPPVASVANSRAEGRNIQTIGWRVELQMNRLEALFDSEWATVGRSRRQLAAAIPDQPASFHPLTVAVSTQATPETAVFRVLVVVEWYTRNVELAGRAELIARAYAIGARSIQIRPEGCHAVRALRVGTGSGSLGAGWWPLVGGWWPFDGDRLADRT